MNQLKQERARKILQLLSSDSGQKSLMRKSVRTNTPFGIKQIDQCLKGGIEQQALHEIRCSHAKDIGAAYGFIFQLLSRLKTNHTQKIIWVSDPATHLDGGILFPAGIAQYGFDPARITLVTPRDFKSAMWAADEAANCDDLAAVIFQVKGNPKAFNITATRRLMMRAREKNVFSCILRQSGEEEASAAATRWRIKPERSEQDENYKPGIGNVRHFLTLERNRNGQVGNWSIAWNHKSRTFENAARKNPPTHSINSLSISANRPNCAA